MFGTTIGWTSARGSAVARTAGGLPGWSAPIVVRPPALWPRPRPVAASRFSASRAPPFARRRRGRAAGSPTKISMLTKPPSRRSSEDDRPEVDEDHLDVERDEEQRVDVERQAEPAVGVAVRVDAGLVREALVDVAPVPMRDQPGGRDRQEDERDARRRRTRRRTRCRLNRSSLRARPPASWPPGPVL